MAGVRVWDLPVRICHWGFALLLPAMWWTAENDEMGWHMRLGIMLLALLVFRIAWGFAGTATARFAAFVRGPGAVLAYLRPGRGATQERWFGHNPLGGWSTLALIFAMLAQVSMGLFAGDPFDGATGPLNHLPGVELADTLTDWHEVFYWVPLGLAGIHVLAIAFYLLVKRDDLVTPMVTGRRGFPEREDGIGAAPAGRALALSLAALGFAGWIWFGGPL